MYSTLSEIHEYAVAQFGAQSGLDRKRTVTEGKNFFFPVFVGIDKEGQELRQNFLWKLGGSNQQTPRQIATKLCAELQLQTNTHDKLIEEQINVGTKHIRDWKNEGYLEPTIINLHVKGGTDNKLAFVDEVYWDFGRPYNSPENYASIVCAELGLDVDWFDKIVKVLGIQIKYLKLVNELKTEEDVRDVKRRRTEAAGNEQQAVIGRCNNPRIEHYNKEKDDFEEINKKYQQLLYQKTKQAKATNSGTVQAKTQIVSMKEGNLNEAKEQISIKQEPTNQIKNDTKSESVLGVNNSNIKQSVQQQPQKTVQKQVSNVQQQQQLQQTGLSQVQNTQKQQQIVQQQQQQQIVQQQQQLHQKIGQQQLQSVQYQQQQQKDQLQLSSQTQIVNNQQQFQQPVQSLQQQQQQQQQIIQKQQKQQASQQQQQQQQQQLIQKQQQQQAVINNSQGDTLTTVGLQQLQPKVLAAPPIAGVPQRVIKLETNSQQQQQQVMIQPVMNISQQQQQQQQVQQINKVNPIMSGARFAVQPNVPKPTTQQWPIPIQTGGEGNQVVGQQQPQIMQQFIQSGVAKGNPSTPPVVSLQPPSQQQQLQSNTQKIQIQQQLQQKQQQQPPPPPQQQQQQLFQQQQQRSLQQMQQQQQQGLSQREVQAVLMRALKQKGAGNNNQGSKTQQ